MASYRHCRTLWMLLVVLALGKQTTTKPAVLDNMHIFDEEIDAISTLEQHGSDMLDYTYDWTLESSGVPSEYADVDVFMTESCPRFCTCVLETILYCSRQGINSVGTAGEDRDSELKILDGSIPRTVTAIHLGYNNLTDLTARIFHDPTEVSESKLQDLYLQSNEIETIHPDAFIFLVKLRNLDLSNNQLTQLVQDCVNTSDDVSNPILENQSCTPGVIDASFLRSTSSSLVSLNLNGNFIRGIPNYSFESVPNLEVLRLSWNEITWISRKAFYGLHKLRVLQLRANPLGVKTAFKLKDILQHFITGEIAVQHNSSSGLDTFDFYPKLHGSRRAKRDSDEVRREYETITLNSLHDLDLGDTNIARFPGVIPPSVRRLYLDSNRISGIPRRILEPVTRLELLQLGANRIESFMDDTFYSMPSIRVLDLSRNNLTRLTARSFTGLRGLVSLRLYGNRHLSELQRKVFWSMPQLRILYLHDCNLANIPPGPWIFRILALWMYGNPIDCNCQNLLSLMVRIYRPIHPSFSLRLDSYRSVLWDDSDTWQYQRPVKTTCAKPTHFKGHNIENIRVSDVLCTYEDHYATEIARQISRSRFMSIDYQQDEPETMDNADIEEMAQQIKDYGYDSYDYDQFEEALKSNASKDKIAAEQTELEVNNRVPKTDLSVPELSVVDIADNSADSTPKQNGGKDQQDLVVPNIISPLEDVLDTDDFSEGLAISSNIGRLKDYGDEKDVLEESDSRRDVSTGTEWVISLPGNVEVDTMENVQENEKTGANGAGDFTYDYAQHVDPSELKRQNGKEDHGAYDVEIEVGQLLKPELETAKEPLEGDIDTQNALYNEPFDVLESKWKEYPQGFAEYPMYDDGNVELDMTSILRFSDEMDSTLSEGDLLRLRDQIRNVNAWRSYQDYYSDVDSSGDGRDETTDLVVDFSDVNGAEDIGGILGNLSLFNISGNFSDYGDFYSTDDILSSNETDRFLSDDWW